MGSEMCIRDSFFDPGAGMIRRRQTTLDVQKVLAAILLTVGVSGTASGQDTGPRKPGLTSQRVILKEDLNASAYHVAFGKLPGSDEVSLLVGTRHTGKDKRGRLRVLQDLGSSTRRQYGDGYWLDDKVPTARIPGG